MSNENKNTLAYVAVIVVFVLAVAIAISAIFSMVGANSNMANLIKQIALTIAVTLVLLVSFDRVKSFKSRGWLIAYIVSCCSVVIFLALEYVKIFQSL